MRVDVDASRFPLVVQSLRYGYGLSDLREVMPVYERLLAEGRRYAVVVNHEPGATIAGPDVRAYLGAWQKERAVQIAKYNVGVAVVLPSIAHRAAMTALTWLFPPVTPQRACGSLLEAVDFACDGLVAQGIELSPRALDLRAKLRRDIGYSIGI